MIPIDAHDLEKCQETVNDGIRLFIANSPPRGWNWMNRFMEVTLGIVETTGTVDSGTSTTLVDATLSDTYDADDDVNGYYVYDQTQKIYALITDYTTLTGTVTVAAWLDYNDNPSTLTPAAADEFSITDIKTVNGEITRYPLDQDFGAVSGDISYAPDTSRGNIITWDSEAHIRRDWQNSRSTGYPLYAAVRQYGYRRYELILNVKPSAADTIVFPYLKRFDGLEVVAGESSSGSATTLVDSTFANRYPDDYFNAWTIKIVSGTGIWSKAVVTDFTSSTCTFTVADWLFLDDTAGGQNAGSDSVYFVEDIDNKHPAGLRFDNAILSAVLAQTEIDFKDVSDGLVDKFYGADLPAAWKTDEQAAPRSLGYMDKRGPRYHVGRLYGPHSEQLGNVTYTS
jgi:hypothetical protein